MGVNPLLLAHDGLSAGCSKSVPCFDYWAGPGTCGRGQSGKLAPICGIPIGAGEFWAGMAMPCELRIAAVWVLLLAIRRRILSSNATIANIRSHGKSCARWR